MKHRLMDWGRNRNTTKSKGVETLNTEVKGTVPKYLVCVHWRSADCAGNSAPPHLRSACSCARLSWVFILLCIRCRCDIHLTSICHTKHLVGMKSINRGATTRSPAFNSFLPLFYLMPPVGGGHGASRLSLPVSN